jgi:hypothetical protein
MSTSKPSTLPEASANENDRSPRSDRREERHLGCLGVGRTNEGGQEHVGEKAKSPIRGLVGLRQSQRRLRFAVNQLSPILVEIGRQGHVAAVGEHTSDLLRQDAF